MLLYDVIIEEAMTDKTCQSGNRSKYRNIKLKTFSYISTISVILVQFKLIENENNFLS